MTTKDKIRELYTERASFYEWLFIDFLGWGRQLYAFFRGSNYLQSNSMVLDAGCGTGIVTRVIYRLAKESGYERIRFHAFDLTESMLEIFRHWILEQGANQIELNRADVMKVELLPEDWKDHDLIVSSTMLEYLPKYNVRSALMNLKTLLRKGGTLLVFITKRNLITHWLAEKWWNVNSYEANEIKLLFHDVGFDEIEFQKLPFGWSSPIMVIEAKSES